MIYIQLSQRTKVGEAQDRSDPGLKPLHDHQHQKRRKQKSATIFKRRMGRSGYYSAFLVPHSLVGGKHIMVVIIKSKRA